MRKLRLAAVSVCLFALACSSGGKTSPTGGSGGDEETGGATGTGGKTTTGGAPGTGGGVTTGGAPGTGGSMAGTGGSTVPPDAGVATDTAGPGPDPNQPKFSFFITSLVAMQRLSK